MSFIIKNLIIHEIKKNRPVTGQKSVPGSAVLIDSLTPTQPNDEWHALLEKALTSTKSDRRLQRGNFIDVKGFKDNFDEYTDTKIDFIKLTKDTTSSLLIEINKVTFATGGFILFTEIEQDNESFFYSIMFKQKMGEDLTYDAGLKRYVLESVEFLDLDKMHQGFCLEVDSYLKAKNESSLFDDEKRPYLYFINMQSGKDTNTSDYFIDTFKCRVVQNASKSMIILLDKTFNTFLNTPDLQPFANEIKDKITVYYNTCEVNKSAVKLSEVENLINTYKPQTNLSDEDFKGVVNNWFEDLVHSPDCPISTSFEISESTLKDLQTYVITVGGFKFSGDKSKLLRSESGDDVYYNREAEEIVISTRSKPIG